MTYVSESNVILGIFYIKYFESAYLIQYKYQLNEINIFLKYYFNYSKFKYLKKKYSI